MISNARHIPTAAPGNYTLNLDRETWTIHRHHAGRITVHGRYATAGEAADELDHLENIKRLEQKRNLAR